MLEEKLGGTCSSPPTENHRGMALEEELRELLHKQAYENQMRP